MSKTYGAPRVWTSSLLDTHGAADPTAKPGALGSTTRYQAHRQQAWYLLWYPLLISITQGLAVSPLVFLTTGLIGAVMLWFNYSYHQARKTAVRLSEHSRTEERHDA